MAPEKFDTLTSFWNQSNGYQKQVPETGQCDITIRLAQSLSLDHYFKFPSGKFLQ